MSADGNSMYERRIAALTADLAHVTAERDDLKEWKVLHEEFTMDWLARVTAERDGLRDCVQAFADTRPCGESVRGCLATWPDNPAGWCDGCRARAALAAYAPPAKQDTPLRPEGAVMAGERELLVAFCLSLSDDDLDDLDEGHYVDSEPRHECVIDAFLAARQPPGERDVSVGEPCAPPAPPRFWRVVQYPNFEPSDRDRFQAWMCDTVGDTIGKPMTEPRSSYRQAVADGVASGLSVWPGVKERLEAKP
jgi:hypothetical protein